MGVQGKFYVAEVTIYGTSGGGGKVVLRAVTRGGANSEWAAATPSGTIDMAVNNPSAFEWFKERIGKECSIAFAEFDPPTEG